MTEVCVLNARQQRLIASARSAALAVPCNWRDCRLCMRAPGGTNPMGDRPIKAGDVVLADWPDEQLRGEDVHAWHTDLELAAFRGWIAWSEVPRVS